MSKSIRILTTPGEKSINVNIEQEFEYLEILSLKLLQSDIYTRQCSDYGVIVGRVSVNGGFGIPNSRISVFIPLDEVDEQNPVISEIYPYKQVTDRNDEGYRYNLLPYNAQHVSHTPTGTFFNREDILLQPNLIYVYDKYYKYTTITNDSGDFMIFGVPTGNQTVFVDIDLSDIGEFSLTPKDLIRMGIATEDQVNKTTFKSSTDLNSLPQIVSIVRNIDVDPLWGQPDICSLGITRTDFDVSKEANIKLRPTAIFMGSIFTTNDLDSVDQFCYMTKEVGELCRLETNSGTIKTVRQTIFPDSNGRPTLEYFDLENAGQVIDENGAWLVEVPMNLDYITTDEFGNRVISLDPLVGVPTKGKYRFKIKWNQTPGLDTLNKRANFLVPNVREYWNSSGGPGFAFGGGEVPPSPLFPDYRVFKTSYAFTNNWDDYGYTGQTTSDAEYAQGLQHIQDAIDCKDKFYEFSFNKVYTVSQLHTQVRKGFSRHRYLGIKNILNTECDSENHKFPANDAIMNVNFLLMLFNILMMLMLPIMYAIVILFHIVVFIVQVLIYPLLVYLIYQAGKGAAGEIANAAAAVANLVPQVALAVTHGLMAALYIAAGITLVYIFTQVPKIQKYFRTFSIPNYTYPNCDMCVCKTDESQDLDELNSENTKEPSGTKEKNQIPVNKDGSNLLTPVSTNVFFNLNDLDLVNASIFSGFGIPFDGEIGKGVGTSGLCVKNKSITVKCNDRNLPEFIDTYDDDGNDKSKGTGRFTSVLPLPEMINLFNLKDKYFSNIAPNSNYNGAIAGNPGGKGTNQIKVTFNTDDNNPATFYHFDNVIAILVGPDQGASLPKGTLITFQDRKLSTDINFSGTVENEYGTTSITGTSLFETTATRTVNVSYADPLNVNSPKTVSYVIKGKPEDSSFLRFPIDVEYFQVIGSEKFSQFKSKQGGTLENSFYSRYLFNSTNYVMNQFKFSYPTPTQWDQDCNQGNQSTYNPQFSYFENYNSQYVIFLVRGVDPLSTKQKVRYDLSKLYGHNVWGKEVVEFDAKLNIPIQGGSKNVQHSIVNNNTIDPYSGIRLFYNSYSFLPTTSDMKPFDTDLTKYYSSLTGTKAGSGNGAYIGRYYCSNSYCKHFTSWSIPNKPNYYVNENLEGGSSAIHYLTYYGKPGHYSFPFFRCTGRCDYNQSSCNSDYVSPIYSNTVKILPSTDVNNNRIVMRSDRLPMSTSTFKPNPGIDSYRFLMANPIFSVYALEDDGSVNSSIPPNAVPSNGEGEVSGVLSTFTCEKLVPLECYKYESVNGKMQITTKPSDDECYTNKLKGKKKIMKSGCYILVTTPFLSIARDFYLISEWNSRFVLITNNWVNGSLFMFSFINQRVFDKKNNPNAKYCNRTVYLDINDVTTENGLQKSYTYYYRSAPYWNGNFYGVNATAEVSKTNKKNLNFPTTIMDLGPRDLFSQEVILSNEYKGYILDTLQNTTFKDTSSIITYFIVSRLTSRGFLNSVGSATLMFYFSRKNSFIDGDVAQLIATNSQYGIYPYNSAYYTDSDAFINNPEGETIIGIYFTGNTQNRDFISPKRTIHYDSGSITDLCGLTDISVKTQTVPFYQWSIIDATEVADQSIFGSQVNEWSTDFDTFFNYDYQKLDRISASSRYFRTNKSVLTKDFNGNIYSIDGNTRVLQSGINTWSRNTTPNDNILLGAPFYFYFGLKKGKTSFDKFTQVWLDNTTVD